jgi:type IV pilus assembly protein PilO
MKPVREKLVSALNLHLLGLGLLLILNLFLGIRLLIAWNTLRDSGPEQLAQQQSAYRTLDLEMRPLRGLPEKVDLSHKQADQFFGTRFPSGYSTISSAVDDLAAKNNVHLTRVSYVQKPAIPGLAEVQLDANLSGEYAPLMHFINGLERSKTFFLINGLTFTGQQGGLVNLRLRLITYLHGEDLDRLAPPASGNSAGEENNQ